MDFTDEQWAVLVPPMYFGPSFRRAYECDGYAYVRYENSSPPPSLTPSPLPTYHSAKAPGISKDRPSKDRPYFLSSSFLSSEVGVGLPV